MGLEADKARNCSLPCEILFQMFLVSFLSLFANQKLKHLLKYQHRKHLHELTLGLPQSSLVSFQ